MGQLYALIDVSIPEDVLRQEKIITRMCGSSATMSDGWTDVSEICTCEMKNCLSSSMSDGMHAFRCRSSVGFGWECRQASLMTELSLSLVWILPSVPGAAFSRMMLTVSPGGGGELLMSWR
jgi:hypothetical protein